MDVSLPLQAKPKASRTYLPRHFGDFQTPPELVTAVLASVIGNGRDWQRALEPTCGAGSFIAGLLASELDICEIQGIEIQPMHFASAQSLAAEHPKVSIRNESLFAVDLSRDLDWKRRTGRLLVIGNPPWVTNSELSALGSDNLPAKTNFKGLRGLDAMTGSGNFDIAEYIWLKLIMELSDQQPTIALLCKTSVARNVLKYAADVALPISQSVIRRIDAKKWFGANVDACLFVTEVGGSTPNYDAAVYADLTSTEPETVIGVREGYLTANVQLHASMSFARDNQLSLTWRQGLKHDSASVMELIVSDTGEYTNKLGESVDIEPEYVYPLMKSSDVFKGETTRARRAVIVTQTSLRDDTAHLEYDAPKLWRYLIEHSEQFEQRKSVIYKTASRFGIFGIGDYSFARFKVAISGMYKVPRFQAIAPIDGRPVMLDDTCYFAACKSLEESLTLARLLNSRDCINQIESMAFSDSKRPITKKLLQRLNLATEPKRQIQGRLFV